jgi:hypothetical protein
LAPLLGREFDRHDYILEAAGMKGAIRYLPDLGISGGTQERPYKHLESQRLVK